MTEVGDQTKRVVGERDKREQMDKQSNARSGTV